MNTERELYFESSMNTERELYFESSMNTERELYFDLYRKLYFDLYRLLYAYLSSVYAILCVLLQTPKCQYPASTI